MGDAQADGQNDPQIISAPEPREAFLELVRKGASVGFAAVAAGVEPGWERDVEFRRLIDRAAAQCICDAEMAAFREVSSGRGNATLVGKFLASRAGWNEKDDFAQQIVILPKIVDGYAEPPEDPQRIPPPKSALG